MEKTGFGKDWNQGRGRNQEIRKEWLYDSAPTRFRHPVTSAHSSNSGESF